MTDLAKQTPWRDETPAANGRPVRENFSAWFGDSAVVDKSGAPLVLYHGTSRNFDSFEKKNVTVNFKNGQKELGFFFSDNAAYAERYASRGTWDESENRPLIMPVYVAMENPRIFTQAMIDDIENGSHGKPRWKVQRVRDLVNELKNQGHDGIVFDIEWKSWDQPPVAMREYAVFDASQIKSAIGNSGLYLRDQTCLTDYQAAIDIKAAQRARQFTEYSQATHVSTKPRLA